MPNGGADCCGTCCFNSANEGEVGYRPGTEQEDVRCTIRDLSIEVPFWTYCANHPHHNPERIAVPVGPVYVTDSYPYSRRVLEASPDTEEIRARVLDLLAQVQEVPGPVYHTPTNLDDELIKQVMAFREERASADLRRIIGFDPLAAPPGADPFYMNRVVTVALAVEALGAIERDHALDALEAALRRGLAGDGAAGAASRGVWSRVRALFPSRRARRREPPADPFAPIRYHAVLGLGHCRSERARTLLEEATADPHPEVAAFAREVLGSREEGA